jgi:hypothetical protein
MRRCGWLLLVLCVAGCDSGPRTAKVSGRILVEGKPVANLRVTFAPVGSVDNPYPGPGSVGFTDEDGRYTLTLLKGKKPGAVVGACRVRVTTMTGGDPGSIDPRKAAQMARLPARFNDETELTFTVPPEGTDAANFDLSWR